MINRYLSCGIITLLLFTSVLQADPPRNWVEFRRRRLDTQEFKQLVSALPWVDLAQSVALSVIVNLTMYRYPFWKRFISRKR